MARDDDEDSGGGKGARSAAQVRSVSHAASGGHNLGKGTPARNQIIQARQLAWNITEDDDEDEGDPMAAYAYVEYPKHVYPWPDEPKRFVQVNNADEEVTALAQGTIVREEDERKRLVALAEVKGVQVDGRWGLGRMEKALSDAGHDHTANPFA